MNSRTYHITFLTPCFCAGAVQNKAELRSSSIRGALRWWFRALGGSISEEKSVFGHVHGDKQSASSIVVRTRMDTRTGEINWNAERNIQRQGMDRSAYLLGFFCGRTHRLDSTEGALPPGRRAEIHILFKRPPSESLELALKMFFSIGAVGFRSSRAAGAISSLENVLTTISWEKIAEELAQRGFHVHLFPDQFRDWQHLIGRAGHILKHRLRGKQEGLGISAGKNGTSPNALGSAEPRQSSVVQFRPVLINNQLRLSLIEAPHERILGEKANRAHGNRGSILELAGLNS